MKDRFSLESKKLTSLGDKFLHKSGSRHFHEKAQELLSKANLHELFDYKKLVEVTFLKSFSHEQNFKAFEFSDLPITVARGSHCFIDVYFWRRRPTVIHNHHFSGAFQCLLGQNLDSEFTFKKNRNLTRQHSLGELTLKRVEKLGPGDVVGINLLDKFIHQNHHQADLTVNLCFRTSELPKKNLSNYLYSGLRYEKDPLTLERARRLFSFVSIEDFDPAKLSITVTDALCFLLESHGTNSNNTRLITLQKFLERKILNELNLDISSLIHSHESKLDSIQAEYE